MNSNVNIRCFRAVDDTETSLQFYDKHKKALGQHGVLNVSSLNDTWMKDENVYVIICELGYTKEMIGGIRVHKKSLKNLLPVEEALQKIQYKINEESFKPHSSGELCAFWVNKNNIYKNKLNKMLLVSGVALTYFLNIDTLMAFAGKHTLGYVLDAGFQLDLKNPGQFFYPTKNHSTNIFVNNMSSILQREYNDSEIVKEFIIRQNFTKRCYIDDQVINVSFSLNPFLPSVSAIERDSERA